jgi:hypothetical protein
VLFVSITYALLDQKPESELEQALGDMVISILLVNMEKEREKKTTGKFLGGIRTPTGV